VYSIPDDYPYKAPVVECRQKVFHPNIDPQGRAVCLSILKDKWQANNELIEVIYGIAQIIESLNHGDIEKPLDGRAAELLKSDVKKFKEVVESTLKGQSFEGRQFDNVWVN
jgi:ubiquitin-protein ligase